MPLRWISKPTPTHAPLAPEAARVVLAAPGSLPPRHRLTQALAAGSLLMVAARPMPGAAPLAPASTFTVTNLNPSGAGSLRQAIHNANVNPGPDTIAFQAGLVGTIPITTQIAITDAVTIQGPGPGKLSVSGSHVSRIFYLYSPAAVPFTATISGLGIRDGFVSKGSGGGILDVSENLVLDQVAIISNTASSHGGGVEVAQSQSGLVVRNSQISGNQASFGGGVYVRYAPNGVLIQNSQIVSNTSLYQGAGVIIDQPQGSAIIEDSTIAGNVAAGGGGGVRWQFTASGTHSIRRTTITGNTALNGAGVYLMNLGQPLVVENSTISGNHATARGGGLDLYGASLATVRNSTIVSNTATQAGGGLDVENGAVPISNTIVAGNAAPLGPDITGTVRLRYDLVQITPTTTIVNAGGNLFGLDPLLGPLANNGGPTQTRLPTVHSPVINAGDPAFAPPPVTDQRGDPRVSGGRVDIGAVEIAAEAAFKLFLPLIQR